MKEEIWKKLPIGNDRYAISNYGNIKTYFKSEEGVLLKPRKDRLGYLKIGLSTKEKRKHFLIHRLVALMFVPNPFMYNEINHIDGNKQNNYYENLEWCTHSHNMKHAFAMGLDYTPIGAEHHSAKAFNQFDMKGNLIKRWDCIAECSRYLMENNEQFQKDFSNAQSLAANICHVLNGKHKSCCGYLFSYADKAEIPTYNNYHQKPVIATDKKTGEQIEFDGVKRTEGYTMPNGKKVIATIVSKCCKGKRDSHAGYYWEYKI